MNRLLFTVLLSTLVISACGGSDPDTTGQQPTSSPLDLTPANAQTAAKVSYAAAIGSGELTDVGGSIGLSAGAPGAQAKFSAAAWNSGFLVNVMQKIPFGPDTLPCADSGTMTLSGDIADPLTLSAGDTFQVVFSACDDGFGEVVDGTLNYTVSAFAGDLLTGRYVLGMDAILTNFQVTTAADVMTSNGDTSVTLDTMVAPFVSSTVAGNSMTVDTNSSSETLSGYSYNQTVDAGVSPSPYTMTAQGTLDSSQLAAVVSYMTPVMFEGFGVDYPDSGELLVTGNNSSVRLVAIDNVNVRIDIDNDGNGSVDESINTTWAALTN